MKGSIFYQKDRGRWAVCWYHHGKPYNIYRYRGEFMYHRKIAEKSLAMIQGRWEEHSQGKCQFRIEEFTGKGWTDVLQFYEEWMKEVIEPNKAPSTIKCYWSYYRNWIVPFFEKYPVRLHEIQLDIINKLKNSIKLTGKGKLNVITALHTMMDYAWRSKRIPEMPPFPKIEEYEIVEPDFDWLWEEQQMKVIHAVPEIHRPIFLWLKYHYRRPGEAFALYKIDFDVFNQAFWIRRAISDRKLVDRTKTGKVHYVPCHPKFFDIAKKLINENIDSPFLFVNPRSRKKAEGGRYTHESLNNLWKAGCKEAGIKPIKPYHGLKHSSCTQFINEYGGTDDELLILTDHDARGSIKRYRKIDLNRKRELMDRGKIIDLGYFKTTSKGKTE